MITRTSHQTESVSSTAGVAYAEVISMLGGPTPRKGIAAFSAAFSQLSGGVAL